MAFSLLQSPQSLAYTTQPSNLTCFIRLLVSSTTRKLHFTGSCATSQDGQLEIQIDIAPEIYLNLTLSTINYPQIHASKTQENL